MSQPLTQSTQAAGHARIVAIHAELKVLYAALGIDNKTRESTARNKIAELTLNLAARDTLVAAPAAVPSERQLAQEKEFAKLTHRIEVQNEIERLKRILEGK
jgi:hypothetical protein